MNDSRKRYIGLGVDEGLNVVLPARRVELARLEAWIKKILTPQDEIMLETPAPTAGAV
ncbi:MAG TPA: hypothetical protein VGA72_09705 [Anaerolineales bacterium]